MAALLQQLNAKLANTSINTLVGTISAKVTALNESAEKLLEKIQKLSTLPLGELDAASIAETLAKVDRFKERITGLLTRLNSAEAAALAASMIQVEGALDALLARFNGGAAPGPGAGAPANAGAAPANAGAGPNPANMFGSTNFTNGNGQSANTGAAAAANAAKAAKAAEAANMFGSTNFTNGNGRAANTGAAAAANAAKAAKAAEAANMFGSTNFTNGNGRAANVGAAAAANAAKAAAANANAANAIKAAQEAEEKAAQQPDNPAAQQAALLAEQAAEQAANEANAANAARNGGPNKTIEATDLEVISDILFERYPNTTEGQLLTSLTDLQRQTTISTVNLQNAKKKLMGLLVKKLKRERKNMPTENILSNVTEDDRILLGLMDYIYTLPQTEDNEVKKQQLGMLYYILQEIQTDVKGTVNTGNLVYGPVSNTNIKKSLRNLNNATRKYTLSSPYSQQGGKRARKTRMGCGCGVKLGGRRTRKARKARNQKKQRTRVR